MNTCEQIHDLIAVVDLQKRLNGNCLVIGGLKVTLDIENLNPLQNRRIQYPDLCRQFVFETP